MHETKLKSGIFTAEVTLYSSGNVHIKVVNRITKESKTFYSKRKKDVRYIK